MDRHGQTDRQTAILSVAAILPDGCKVHFFGGYDRREDIAALYCAGPDSGPPSSL